MSFTPISNGETSSGLILPEYFGSQLTVLYGGKTEGTIVNSGDTERVDLGGAADATVVSSGGNGFGGVTIKQGIA
jgi:autotransporter passenger strand-loop-strand repeat protein